MENDITKEIIVKGTTKTLRLGAQLGNLVRLVKIHSNMANNSKIFAAVIHSHTASVFIEIHVQTPVQRIFNAPVLSDRPCKFLHISHG